MSFLALLTTLLTAFKHDNIFGLSEMLILPAALAFALFDIGLLTAYISDRENRQPNSKWSAAWTCIPNTVTKTLISEFHPSWLIIGAHLALLLIVIGLRASAAPIGLFLNSAV